MLHLESIRLFQLGRAIGLPANQALKQAKRWQKMFASTKFIDINELPPTHFKR